MTLRYILLSIIGISSGALVAAGLFAFIVALGLINRLVTKTKTAKYIRLYEYAIIAGAIILNATYLFSQSIPTSYFGLILFGLFSGLFIGVQSMALTETIKTIPIMVLRIKLGYGLPFIILSIALGKTIATLVSFFLF